MIHTRASSEPSEEALNDPLRAMGFSQSALFAPESMMQFDYVG
jgi:hypothetical protein